jgi:hypothetical protein
MTPTERKAFDAMVDALTSIHEVDDLGDGIATVNIDYVEVTRALDLVDKVNAERRTSL